MLQETYREFSKYAYRHSQCLNGTISAQDYPDLCVAAAAHFELQVNLTSQMEQLTSTCELRLLRAIAKAAVRHEDMSTGATPSLMVRFVQALESKAVYENEVKMVEKTVKNQQAKNREVEKTNLENVKKQEQEVNERDKHCCIVDLVLDIVGYGVTRTVESFTSPFRFNRVGSDHCRDFQQNRTKAEKTIEKLDEELGEAIKAGYEVESVVLIR